MTERPLFIMDASVVTRWYLLNPPYLAESLQVRHDYESDKISLVAPGNLRYEVGGAIRHAVNTRYIQARQGIDRYLEFVGLELTTIDTAELLVPAFRLSVRLGCGFYDAIYLMLAESRRLPFLYADQRLRNTLGNRFPLATWIEDYTPVL